MLTSGLKNEKLVSDIELSGSLILPTRNTSGVYQFTSDNRRDGVVSGKLVKPKYNVEELVKSIDTTIFELLPIEEPELPETVLKVIYDAALEDIRLRDITIAEQTDTILDLRGKVAELEIVSQSLRVEIDGKELLVANADNQASQATNRISSAITDLQNAIQKATAESIQRVSLFARNQSLEQELSALRNQLFGKEGKLAEGAKVGEDFAAKILEVRKKDAEGDIAYRARANEKTEEWVNGPTLELTNFTTNKDTTISFSLSGDSIINVPSSVTLKAGETKTVVLKENIGWIRGQKPKGTIGLTGDRQYRGSLKMKSSAGSSSEVTLSVFLDKYRENGILGL
jgi:hypothetical protein